jgi:hypothetical protein
MSAWGKEHFGWQRESMWRVSESYRFGGVGSPATAGTSNPRDRVRVDDPDALGRGLSDSSLRVSDWFPRCCGPRGPRDAAEPSGHRRPDGAGAAGPDDPWLGAPRDAPGATDAPTLRRVLRRTAPKAVAQIQRVPDRFLRRLSVRPRPRRGSSSISIRPWWWSVVARSSTALVPATAAKSHACFRRIWFRQPPASALRTNCAEVRSNCRRNVSGVLAAIAASTRDRVLVSPTVAGVRSTT